MFQGKLFRGKKGRVPNASDSCNDLKLVLPKDSWCEKQKHTPYQGNTPADYARRAADRWSINLGRKSSKGRVRRIAPVVVIDGESVGRCFRCYNDEWDARGVISAVKYYMSHGESVVVVDEDRLAELPGLVARGRIVGVESKVVPLCVLKCAERIGADLVTNFKFTEILASQTSEKNRKQLEGFLNEHLVRFVFAFEQLLPFDDTDVVCDSAGGGTEKKKKLLGLLR